MIICCGESLIDMLPRELPDEGTAFLPVSGGAVFNTAIALGRLEATVSYFGGLSTDMFGEILIESLGASNVDYSLCPRLDKPTTLAFVKLQNGHAQYTFIDEASAGRLLELEHIPVLGDSVRALHFGAISLIPEPCGSTFETLMRNEHEQRVISLDPNIRTSFIQDTDAHRARMARMIGMSDIVKVSDEDMQWFDSYASFEAAAQSWISGGTSIVILTKGAEGVTALTRHHNVSLGAPTVNVVDTVGAGDTFNAGFLAALSKAELLDKASLQNISETDLANALEFAIKVAAVTVQRAGANPPWLHEL